MQQLTILKALGKTIKEETFVLNDLNTSIFLVLRFPILEPSYYVRGAVVVTLHTVNTMRTDMSPTLTELAAQ